MEKVALLTAEQEQFVLELLKSYDVVDNGASRIVFLPNTYDLVRCGLTNLDMRKEYAVKVSIGIAGINQTAYEVQMYEQYGDEGCFADIYYVGKYIEVMERVVAYDFRDYYEEPENDFIDYLMEDFDLESDVAMDAYHVIHGDLYSIVGDNGDRAQIGRRDNGDWVAYDYGYDDTKNNHQQCSNLQQDIEFYATAEKEYYLDTLISLLYNEDLDELDDLICSIYDNRITFENSCRV